MTTVSTIVKCSITCFVMAISLSMSLSAQTKVGIWEGFNVNKVYHADVADQICFDAFDELVECPSVDDEWHGTMVANLATAGTDNVELYGLRFVVFSDRDWNRDKQEILDGVIGWIDDSFDYWKSKGVEYVNMSFGTNYEDLTGGYGLDDRWAKTYLFEMEMAYRRGFSENTDISFIVASGNDGGDVDSIISVPANIDLPNVIVVGAHESWANTGKAVRIKDKATYVDAFGRDYQGTSLSAPNYLNKLIRR